MVSFVLFSFVLPVVAGVGVLAIGWLIPPLRRREWITSSTFGIALGVGLLLSYLSELGVPEFPPQRSDIWIGWLGIAVLPLAILFSLTSRRGFPWLELCGVVLGGLIALLPIVSGVENFKGDPKPLFPGMGVAAHGALAFMIAFGYVALGRLQDVRRGATIPVALALSFGGSAMCALASGWITMTIFFGVLASLAGVGAILTRFSGSPAIGRGGAVVAVLLLVVLPVASWHKTTAPDALSWWFWLLLAGAPFLLLVCENRVFEKIPALVAFWIRTVLVAIPVAFVLCRVVPMLLGETSGGGDGMDDMMWMNQ